MQTLFSSPWRSFQILFGSEGRLGHMKAGNGPTSITTVSETIFAQGLAGPGNHKGNVHKNSQALLLVKKDSRILCVNRREGGHQFFTVLWKETYYRYHEGASNKSEDTAKTFERSHSPVCSSFFLRELRGAGRLVPDPAGHTARVSVPGVNRSAASTLAASQTDRLPRRGRSRRFVYEPFANGRSQTVVFHPG